MFVFRDVRECRDEIGEWASGQIAQIDHLEEEFRHLFRQTRKKIQAIKREVSVEQKMLNPHYRDAVTDVKKYDLDAQSQK